MEPVPTPSEPCSLTEPVLRSIFEHARPLGHAEAPRGLNLGFGFLYYALARALRPKHVLVIGSGYGFSVVCFALGLKDNGQGRLTFVDPSFSLLRNGPLRTVGGVNAWTDADVVRRRFARFGVDQLVTHHKLTSADFFGRWSELDLPPVDLGFIDGNHSYRHVRHDFLRILERSRRNTYLLLHDTNLVVRELVGHAGVRRWLRRVRREPDVFEVVDFPFASGLAVVRVMDPRRWSRPA